MLTFNGRLSFNDELQMVDTTESLVEYGDDKYDLAVWYVWDNYGQIGLNVDEQYALPASPIEPGMSFTAIPFYLLGKLLPGISVIHVIWMSNISISAAACVVIYVYSLVLGYQERVALLAAFALGILTVLWPYSRTFLREPLNLLGVLGVGLLLEIWRQQRNHALLLFAFVVLVLALLTKESTVMAIPGLIMILVPQIPNGPKATRLFIVVMLLSAMTLIILTYTDVLERVFAEPITLYGPYVFDAVFFRQALQSYLLSMGASIWGTSPILLMAIPGAVIAWKRGELRYILVGVMLLMLYAVGHAVTGWMFWFGGATLPPRFLIPVIPFLLIVALPAFDYVLMRASQFWRVLFVTLGLYSLWWQVSGAVTSWYDYGPLLPERSGGLAEWGPGMNRLEYLRPVLLTQRIFDRPLELIWVRLDVVIWPVLFGILVILWGILLFRVPRIQLGRVIIAFGVMSIAFCFVLFSLLRMVDQDPVYLSDNDALVQIDTILDEVERPNDVVLLDVPDYHWYFLTSTQRDDARVVALPLASGERGSFEESIQGDIDEPSTLLDPLTIQLVNGLASQRDRIWLLMSSGPYLPWNTRPLERYFSRNYYPIQFIETAPDVRLIEYHTTLATQGLVDGMVYEETNLVFGDQIELSGFLLPKGLSYSQGDYLPISLYWETSTEIDTDYTIAAFLVNSDGVVVAQAADSMPAGGFMPMTQWRTNTIVADNRAIRLPETLPDGAYQLWLRLYRFEDGEINALPVTGDSIVENDLAELPVSIIISTPTN